MMIMVMVLPVMVIMDTVMMFMHGDDGYAWWLWLCMVIMVMDDSYGDDGYAWWLWMIVMVMMVLHSDYGYGW